jgi:dihydropteroate synthase
MTELVGILNVTPDSFSDGGKYFDPAAAIEQAEKLFADGAAWIDVGAESTRPNAQQLTDDEEWARLEPVLKVLILKYPGRISLDSYHPATIRKAFEIGPVIVNDVTGLNNLDMVNTVIELQATVIVSHLPGSDIQTAHKNVPVATMAQVKQDLLAKARELEDKGLERSKIILDPGIGFGKTMELNRELLTFADQVPDYKVMIGYSRKRFLGDNRMELEPNLEAGRTAIQHGAAYLRVHDIAGHQPLLEY